MKKIRDTTKVSLFFIAYLPSSHYLSSQMNKELITFLSNLVKPERFTTLQEVLSNRTRHLCVVLEDIYQSQNASAVLRTCDCFGVQDVHIIENENEYNINPDVVLGSSKWLSINKYNNSTNNTEEALLSLKKKGYKIVATSPHSNDVNLEDFDITQEKTALVFGTELTGISPIVEKHASTFIKIPMFGFTESFNISVSAAISLNYLMSNLRKSSIHWQLAEKDKEIILIDWLMKTVKHSDKVVDRFYHERGIKPDEAIF